jgi:PAS domain-containing protein
VHAEWIKSPTARLVLVHWADARPAWLWSQDGETLLWRNDAARYFHGKIKKHGLKLAPEAVPIKGQIARLIRLGSMGRSSLSRIQFLAGERPISTTCTCTPLELDGGDTGLLIVGVDPIEPELLEAHDPMQVDTLTAKLLPDAAEFLLISEDGQIAGGSHHAIEHYAPIIESEGLPHDADGAETTLAGDTVLLTRFRASPHDALLLLFERPGAPAGPPLISDVRAEEGIVTREDAPAPFHASAEPEPMLPMGLPPVEHADDEPVIAEEDNWVEPIPAAPEVPGTLASLFDRLADDGGLYTALNPGDEHFAGPPPEAVEEPLVPAPVETAEVAADEPPPALEFPPEAAPIAVPAPLEPDVIGALIDFADEEGVASDGAAVEADHLAAEPVAADEVKIEVEVEVEVTPEPEPQPVTTWRVVGRGFVPLAPELPADDEPAEVAAPIPDAETVERVSRYNFDELSRILTDRVSAHPSTPPVEAPPPPVPGNEGALINLTGETFILNRLPLGILVFRDQQVLFANRALTDLTGYESIESLRAAGLTAIFPSEDSTAAGPVTQLVRRDGSLATVNARLQSITWHGRPALMLSAGIAENRIGHEAAVRTFAELAAETGDDGFLAADRSGTITSVSLHGRIVLGHLEEDIVGKPLASFIEPSQLGELKRFLERPARFAETARPAILLDGLLPGTRLTLFAEGQAGIIAGYYAFVRKAAPPAVPAVVKPATDDIEPSMLTRISRGVRRPLNTVIGFADLIRSAAFGSIDNQRYVEYAQDIKAAGQEIAHLVDEVDDYSRLREGRYPAEASDIDLVTLLESCLARVRGQASEARVLVRNAISERLPRITADTASLTQAILNLLASAIDQTPVGGSVILSAQQEDDGAVIVNVRDGGEARRDLGERFVVFRDGVGKDGEALQPVRSSVGLALTRSLLAVNALQLSVDPAVGVGTMFSLLIPADLVRETGQ